MRICSEWEDDDDDDIERKSMQQLRDRQRKNYLTKDKILLRTSTLRTQGVAF